MKNKLFMFTLGKNGKVIVSRRLGMRVYEPKDLPRIARLLIHCSIALRVTPHEYFTTYSIYN